MRYLPCLLDGLADGIQIIAVLNGNQLEPEGFHALLYILCKCDIRASLDGNTVGIIKYNKLAQSQGTSSENASEEMPSIMQPSPPST